MKEVHLTVKLPKDVPDDDKNLQLARKEGLETMVVRLWQGGHLSTREAAGQLGLTYPDYLDLLDAKGIPVVTEMADEQALERAHRKLQGAR